MNEKWHLYSVYLLYWSTLVVHSEKLILLHPKCEIGFCSIHRIDIFPKIAIFKKKIINVIKLSIISFCWSSEFIPRLRLSMQSRALRVHKQFTRMFCLLTLITCLTLIRFMLIYTFYLLFFISLGFIDDAVTSNFSLQVELFLLWRQNSKRVQFSFVKFLLSSIYYY